ncbi:MAG: HNH endonuclease [Cyclobacteriaceae bacterium]
MDNKIETAYSFKKEELSLIKANCITHDDWDKNVFSTLKGNIRDALRPEQGNKCCYCKKVLGHDIKEVDIEHIISKATYPKFTFESKNLALSCPACNTIKGDKPVLSKKIVRHPSHSKNHTIVHAHYDDYSLHIKIHDGCVFEPLTKKGSHTITTCELFRLKLVEKKAKASLSKKSEESELINLIMNASPTELTDAMKELMKRIK